MFPPPPLPPLFGTLTVTWHEELLPLASVDCTVIVYTRAPPELDFVAASNAVRLPVIWISPGAVTSLHVIETIFVTGAGSQLSETDADTVTGAN